ncbi:MAG: hypothetical protein ACAH17_02260 [Candidatus Paceibacterota bacterium]
MNEDTTNVPVADGSNPVVEAPAEVVAPVVTEAPVVEEEVMPVAEVATEIAPEAAVVADPAI